MDKIFHVNFVKSDIYILLFKFSYVSKKKKNEGRKKNWWIKIKKKIKIEGNKWKQ